MQTIFDHSPAIAELFELFMYDDKEDTLIPGTRSMPLPREAYDRISDEEKLLDLAQLFELRGKKDAADEIWAQIPDLHRQYKGGFDNEMAPVV